MRKHADEEKALYFIVVDVVVVLVLVLSRDLSVV
jgi:hypothetical protein